MVGKLVETSGRVSLQEILDGVYQTTADQSVLAKPAELEAKIEELRAVAETGWWPERALLGQ